MMSLLSILNAACQHFDDLSNEKMSPPNPPTKNPKNSVIYLKDRLIGAE